MLKSLDNKVHGVMQQRVWKCHVNSVNELTQRLVNRCLVQSAVWWLGSWVVSLLDSGEEGPWFTSQPRRCRVTVLGKLFTPIVPLFTKQQKLVAALLRVARVTAGLAESNGSLPPGLWLPSPAGWLPRTGISSGTLRTGYLYLFYSL